MSKVGEYFRELEELNGPVQEPTEEDMAIAEPTDDELAEIEADLEAQEWHAIHKDCELC